MAPDYTLKQFYREWELATALNMRSAFAGVTTIQSRKATIRAAIERDNAQLTSLSRRRRITFAKAFELTYGEPLHTQEH